MNRIEEFEAKQRRISKLLDERGWDALFLRTRSNIAWLGCGPADSVPLDQVQGSRSEIWHQSETGVMTFLATKDDVVLVTENIELPRLMRDEFEGLPLQVLGQSWHESDPARAAADILRRGAVVATDQAEPPLNEAFSERGLTLVDQRADIAPLRASLLPRELDRYRWLGQTAAEVLTAVCQEIRRGVAEADVAADAHRQLQRFGISQEVDIVCSDDRLWEDRHGLYSDRRIDQFAMVVFCAHKWGLVANLTRMVYLGPLPNEIAERHQALSAFDARLMNATRPGVPLRDIFTGTLQAGYAELGEPNAWQDHHQGGSTGYTGRDQRVTPTTKGVVQPYQAFAWNPSLPGIKSEDTFVVMEDGPEVLTTDPVWPVYPESGRPRILELS